jgi:putative ABC transport system permease protein
LAATARLVRLLSLRWLWVHPIRALMAFVAVSAGLSLALAVLVTDSSVSWSFHSFAARLAPGSVLEVTGATARGGLEEKVLSKVERVAGVAAALPVVQAVTFASAEVESGRYRRDPVLALGIGSHPLSVSRALAVRLGSAGAKVRTGAFLQSDSGPLSLAGVPIGALPRAMEQMEVVVMPLDQAQRLFDRHGRLDAIYVVVAKSIKPASLIARLSSVVGPQNAVEHSGSLPPEAAVVVRSFLPLLGLLAVMAAAVSAVLVRDIVNLALAERRRTVSVLAAIGAPPWVSALPLVDVGVIGLAAGASAVLGGALAARAVLSVVDGLVHPLTGVSLSVHPSAWEAAGAPLAGLALVAAAAFGPLRRATQADVVAELSGRAELDQGARRVRPVRLAVWAAVACAGLGGCAVASIDYGIRPWQFPLGLVSFALAVVGFTAGIATLAPIAMDKASPRASRAGPSWRLAIGNLARNPLRTGTMSVAIAGAVALAFVAASFDRSVADSITQSLRYGADNWVYVSTGPPSSVTIDTEERFTSRQLQRLAAVPGVERVVSQMGLLTGHSGSSLIGIETSSDLDVAGIPVIEGRYSVAALRRGEAMIGPAVARAQRTGPGGQVELDTPTGIVRLRVVGVWADGDFNGSSVFVSEREMARLYGPQQPSNVYAFARKGVSPASLARAIRAANLGADVAESTPHEAAAAEVRSAARQVAPFWALQRSLLVLSFVAVASSLLLAGAQRRREHAILLAIGFGPDDLTRCMLAEGVAVGALSGLLGGVLGAAVLASLVLVLPLVSGYRDPYVLSLSTWVAYGFAAMAVSLAAAFLPARRVGRLDPVEALREE